MLSRSNHWRKNLVIDPVLRALIVSVLIHASFYGTWKLGNAYGWWKPSRFSRAAHELVNSILPAAKVDLSQSQRANNTQEPPLMFIEVNPEFAADPPKDAKFYGAASTEAASPEKDETALPKIDGKQEKMLKVTEDSRQKAMPLQPTPLVKAAAAKDEEARPKQAETPGDMAMKKSAEKEIKDGELDAKGAAEEAQKKPRTLREAARKNGTSGVKSKTKGGTPRVAMSSSLSAKQTALGEYDAEMIDAIRQDWYDQLSEVTTTTPGQVVVEFNLHSDGSVSELTVVQSEVGEMLAQYCYKAIRDPHFREWPPEMKHQLNGTVRSVKFTFYYLSE